MKKILIFLLFLWAACQTPAHRQTEGKTIQLPKIAPSTPYFLDSCISAFHFLNPGLDGVLVQKGDSINTEAYFNGYAANSPHKIWSITKAITAILIGCEVDSGRLSLETSIGKYLAPYVDEIPAYFDQVQLQHLLTMTSGIDWNEMGGPESIGYQLPYATNWLAYVAQQKQAHPPGTHFTYSSGNSILLPAMLRASTGKSTIQMATEKLFNPLNIRQYRWDLQSEFWQFTAEKELESVISKPHIKMDPRTKDLANTASGLHMIPRDLAKIGQLFLQKGRWQNQQIVSNQWIENSLTAPPNNYEYAFHWRKLDFNGAPVFMASGFGLQKIYIIPSLDVVIVTTQTNYRKMQEMNALTEDFVKQVMLFWQ